jgi:hypothetical protein
MRLVFAYSYLLRRVGDAFSLISRLYTRRAYDGAWSDLAVSVYWTARLPW